jgi:hypothetical protein
MRPTRKVRILNRLDHLVQLAKSLGRAGVGATSELMNREIERTINDVLKEVR